MCPFWLIFPLKKAMTSSLSYEVSDIERDWQGIFRCQSRWNSYCCKTDTIHFYFIQICWTLSLSLGCPVTGDSWYSLVIYLSLASLFTEGGHVHWIDGPIAAKGTIFKQYQKAYVFCGSVKSDRCSFGLRRIETLVIAKQQNSGNSAASCYAGELGLEQSCRVILLAGFVHLYVTSVTWVPILCQNGQKWYLWPSLFSRSFLVFYSISFQSISFFLSPKGRLVSTSLCL